MATKLNRPTLKQLFSDGERPTGDNFESAWMSFLNQKDDEIAYNKTNNNIELGPNTGLVLGNPTVGVSAGTLRFNSGTGTVQFYDGTNFKDIAGGAGAFVPVGTGPSVAFNGGNVGIGTASAVPAHRLEIPLGDNTGTGQQILLGNLVVHNGPSTATGAYIGNNNFGSHALFQDNIGATQINASNANNSQLSLAINGDDKFVITQDGNITLRPTTNVAVLGQVTVGNNANGRTMTITNRTNIAANPQIAALRLIGDSTGNANAIPTLFVDGVAAKSGGLVWVPPVSDARVKKEIRVFEEGLDKIIQLKPVIYKYNGKGETSDDGRDFVGFVAQDVQKVVPGLVTSKSVKLNPEDEKESELLNYDFHNVLFMFINAFKEINEKVEKLEKANKK